MVVQWVKEVTTVSTFPPPGTFTKSAEEVARIMARPEVSPLGVHSGVKMIHYFINRGGRGLSAARKRELRRAAELTKHKKPPAWRDPPKTCGQCGRRFRSSFYVVRKQSDKQLIVLCPTCFQASDDVSESRKYRKEGSKAVQVP